jgi:hypothetical protein
VGAIRLVAEDARGGHNHRDLQIFRWDMHYPPKGTDDPRARAPLVRPFVARAFHNDLQMSKRLPMDAAGAAARNCIVKAESDIAAWVAKEKGPHG